MRVISENNRNIMKELGCILLFMLICSPSFAQSTACYDGINKYRNEFPIQKEQDALDKLINICLNHPDLFSLIINYLDAGTPYYTLQGVNDEIERQVKVEQNLKNMGSAPPQ
jgi:hypothetical protein